MEVLQCDGCDFRAQSYEDLKGHIQDVHTAFLQPTDVTEESSSQARSVGTNSSNQSEPVFPSLKDEFVPTEETHDENTSQPAPGLFYSHSPGFYGQSSSSSSKPTNKFFQCKYCIRYFRSKYLLVEHTKKVHGPGGGNPGGPGNANFNVMLHDSFGKVFSCQFCTYKSPRRARIVKHQKMYHKNNLKEMSTPSASHTPPASMPVQETCKELPAEVVERSILESMVKPLTKSRGNFCCEWCSYQTPRRERWCDHMMKKHRGMVKILSSLRQDGLSISDLQNRASQMPNPGTSYMPVNISTHDTASASMPLYRGSMTNLPVSNHSKYQSMPYVPIKPKVPSNPSHLNLNERPNYGVSEKSNSMIDMDESSFTGSGQDTLKKKLKEKVVVGYKCKFCVEVHPTLRAICNHLRKHIQYGHTPPLPSDSKDDADASSKDAEMEPAEPKPAAEEEASKEVKPKLMKRCRPGGYPCKQCDRVLMSMQGLRSHERSHLALAMFTREDKYSCQFCAFVSAFRHNLDRHLQEHHGQHKPFRCKHCPFKSASGSRLKTHIAKAHGGEHAYKCSFCHISKMTIIQLKDHCIKTHGKTLTLPKVRSMIPSSPRAKQSSRSVKEGLEDSAYSEPPDVQQQITHYQTAALARNNSSSSPTPLPMVNTVTETKEELILKCEFCDFASGYIQSIRRHYRDKHGGKKLFKCKDCFFYTSFKSAFTMHLEAGHSTVQQEGPKDLRCPLCLYHTKYKHNMIDHIVLHREERVVPIEVCRSKLSKQLQGVVFRCDKCTFTCSSDENLQQHIEKHNEVRPYKCQLCYYETKQNEELDNHLREEHKVSRNFELVGLVNLDQLEQMKEKTESSSSDDEETAAKLEDTAQIPDVTAVNEEKRFPCEFCGRTFALRTEWEKHVLRHGMTVAGVRKENEENKKPTETMEDLQNDTKHAEETVDTSQQTKSSCLNSLAVTKNE
ncbi:zinc finger protein 462 [Hyperolius riggenbachi]|uniref:zinc finger protein 462 n=1 Tax=Hyperolius riggenbachi TaxID=752182 RepID=UPI0035A3CFE1